MNKDQRRRRRIGAATLVGLATMLVALVVAPSAGQATSTDTRVADSTWQEVLTIEDPAPRLTLREVRQMAERATGKPIRASDLSVVVDGGRDHPGTLLVSLVDGPGLDTPIPGADDDDDGKGGTTVIVFCIGCTVNN